MIDRWRQLGARERLVLGGGGLLAILLLGWAFVWQPLERDAQALGSRVAALEADLAWMRQTAAQIASQQASNGPNASMGGSPLSVVESGLTAARLNSGLKQLSPVGEGRVRVVLEAVSFDALMDWLEQLDRDFGLSPEEFSAQQKAPGAVDATLVLKPGRAP